MTGLTYLTAAIRGEQWRPIVTKVTRRKTQFDEIKMPTRPPPRLTTDTEATRNRNVYFCKLGISSLCNSPYDFFKYTYESSMMPRAKSTFSGKSILANRKSGSEGITNENFQKRESRVSFQAEPKESALPFQGLVHSLKIRIFPLYLKIYKYIKTKKISDVLCLSS